MYEDDLDVFAEVAEFRLRIGLSVADLKPLIDYQADYNFFFRGEFVPAGVLEQLTGVRIALSSEPFPRVSDGRYEFTLDSLGRYMTFRCLRYMPFDYVFHYDAASLPVLKRDKLFLSGEFAFPVATSIYRSRELQKKWDLFFIGRSTPHREAHFGLLKHHYNFLHICHGVWGEPLVDYICAAKICLNIHAENEVSWEPRMQMMLACGAFVISEKITPNPYLRPGTDYVEVGSSTELHSAVKYYLENDALRNEIAKQGQARVLEMLSSRKCFQDLIDHIEQNRYRRFTAGRGSLLFDGISTAERIWRKIKHLRSWLK